MEIINAHAHLIELQTMLSKMGDVQLPGDVSVLRDLDKTMPLLDPSALLKQMDEAGVSKTVLYAVEAPIVYSSNEYVAEMVKRWPDRFIGFASVNPMEDDAADKLDKLVNEKGFKGLKLHPPLQKFYPHDEKVYPVYAKAQDLNIPIVFHVGTTPFGCLCQLDQAAPINLDPVAVQFPHLKIMLTHLGTLSHLDAFMVVEKNPNVYIDTAAYLYEITELVTQNLISRIGADKIIFGTDYPMPFAGKVHKLKDFVDCIKDLKITQADKERIFSTNFLDMLKKDPKSAPTVSLAEMTGFINQEKQ